ncbi:unnamed protein product [Allacma fusca]|uniref:PH domain-containing protein n=1 Tax=Allacma fusca TaxID=39272 RepID=A0A8J2JX21_9HEXA|nr:unnamed protein product [Allacma fusca]
MQRLLQRSQLGQQWERRAVTKYACIWHAFSTLTDEDGLTAPKSRLKVLVASLGTILECQGVDKGLEDFRSTSGLNFAQFDFYLEKEVFSSLSDSVSRKELAPLESSIDETCWIVTKSKLTQESLKRDPCLDVDSAFKLFRIFCLLADLVRDEDGNAQVLLCSEEADLVFTKFLSALSKEWDLREEFECLFSNAIFDLPTFLSVIELKFMKNFQVEEVIEVIHDIYDEFVDDTIKKGALLKRGEYLPKFVERLFILRSSGLTYYSNPKKPKVIEFDADTRVEEILDSSDGKLHQINVITSDRVLQLATLDKRYRSQWVTSLKMALSRLHFQESYGRYLRNKRRLEWHRIRIRRQVEDERAREMLMAEKLARIAAEDQAKELAQQKAIEEEERRHLDEVRRQLEKLLAEEIQAKKDEELVRCLQAQILNEEWEKREELEKLQVEQRRLLDMERNKTKTFQQRQAEMERQLEEAEMKLRELEKTRVEMDLELRAARQKNAERNREILETRLKLFSAPIVEDEKIRLARRSVSMREGKQHLALFRPSPNLPRTEFQHSSVNHTTCSSISGIYSFSYTCHLPSNINSKVPMHSIRRTNE